MNNKAMKIIMLYMAIIHHGFTANEPIDIQQFRSSNYTSSSSSVNLWNVRSSRKDDTLVWGLGSTILTEGVMITESCSGSQEQRIINDTVETITTVSHRDKDAFIAFGNSVTDEYKILWQTDKLSQKLSEELATYFVPIPEDVWEQKNEHVALIEGIEGQILNNTGITSLSSDAGLSILSEKLMSTGESMLWTGAGISVSAGVPSHLDLFESLGLDPDSIFQGVTETSLLRLIELCQNDKNIIVETSQILINFLEKVMLFTNTLEQTNAHKAIADIKQLLKKNYDKELYYYSSNLDNIGLEEDIDVIERKIYKMPLDPKIEVKPAVLIITGLRILDKDFADVFVENGGEIICVDQRKPPFYTKEGKIFPFTWIEADAQEFFPALYGQLSR